jgi:Uma2 family endonuclease
MLRRVSGPQGRTDLRKDSLVATTEAVASADWQERQSSAGRCFVGSRFHCTAEQQHPFREANSMPSPDAFVITVEDWKLACQQDDYLSAAPVLVVEILSPANRKERVASKVELYLSEGVAEVWLIHPKAKTVEVIRKDRRFFGDESLQLPEPLSGLIEIASVFAI